MSCRAFDDRRVAHLGVGVVFQPCNRAPSAARPGRSPRARRRTRPAGRRPRGKPSGGPRSPLRRTWSPPRTGPGRRPAAAARASGPRSPPVGSTTRKASTASRGSAANRPATCLAMPGSENQPSSSRNITTSPELALTPALRPPATPRFSGSRTVVTSGRDGRQVGTRSRPGPAQRRRRAAARCWRWPVRAPRAGCPS